MTNLPPVAPDPRDNPDLDDAIPMLTEVVQVPEPRPAAPEAAAPSDAEWAALAQRIHDEAAGRLAARAEEIFGQALEGMLQQTLQRHAAALHAELAQSFAQIARDAVARAVDEALAGARATSAEPGAQEPPPI